MLNHLIQNFDIENRKKKIPCERREGIDDMRYSFTPHRMEASGHLHAPAAILQSEILQVSIEWETRRVPLPIWTSWRRKQLLLVPGIESCIVQPSHYTPYAIPDITEPRTFEDWANMLTESAPPLVLFRIVPVYVHASLTDCGFSL